MMRKTMTVCLVGWLALALGSPSLRAEDPFAFMPKGGKSLLLEILADVPATQDVLPFVTERKSPDEWVAYLTDRSKAVRRLAGFTEQERRTLAAYLAINTPLSADQIPQRTDLAAWKRVLPADGRELALRHCPVCHSLYSSFLTQNRDVQGWLGTFEVPFHREIKMTEKERETFSHYSAINMPVKEALIPRELRF